jgi:hypothetical protein
MAQGDNTMYSSEIQGSNPKVAGFSHAKTETPIYGRKTLGTITVPSAC